MVLGRFMPKKSYDGAMRAVRIIEAQRKMSNAEQRTHSRANVVQHLQQLIQERDGLEQLKLEIMRSIDEGDGPDMPEQTTDEYWDAQFKWNVKQGNTQGYNDLKPADFEGIRKYRAATTDEKKSLMNGNIQGLTDNAKKVLRSALDSVNDDSATNNCLVNKVCAIKSGSNRCGGEAPDSDAQGRLEDSDDCMCNFLQPFRCFNPNAAYRQRAGADPYKGNAEYRQVTAQLDAVKRRIKETLGMYRMFK